MRTSSDGLCCRAGCGSLCSPAAAQLAAVAGQLFLHVHQAARRGPRGDFRVPDHECMCVCKIAGLLPAHHHHTILKFCAVPSSDDIIGGEQAQAPPQLQIVCPAGAIPGAQLQIQSPTGQLVQVAVPAGVVPGAAFTVTLPGPAAGELVWAPVAHAAEHSECLMRQCCGPRECPQSSSLSASPCAPPAF